MQAARNRGYLEAKGTLVAFMDDDDVMHPERLERQVAEFLKDPGLAVVSVSMVEIDLKGAEVQPHPSPSNNTEWFKLSTLFSNQIGFSNVMLNKRFLDNLALQEYIQSPEWYLWLKLLFQGDRKGHPVRFQHIYEPLQQSREHTEGGSTDHFFGVYHSRNNRYFKQMYPWTTEPLDDYLFFDLFVCIILDLENYELVNPERAKKAIEEMISHYDKKLANGQDT